jgi:hypothetical protein
MAVGVNATATTLTVGRAALLPAHGPPLSRARGAGVQGTGSLEPPRLIHGELESRAGTSSATLLPAAATALLSAAATALLPAAATALLPVATTALLPAAVTVLIVGPTRIDHPAWNRRPD